jgi:hypothetical protein
MICLLEKEKKVDNNPWLGMMVQSFVLYSLLVYNTSLNSVGLKRLKFEKLMTK